MSQLRYSISKCYEGLERGVIKNDFLMKLPLKWICSKPIHIRLEEDNYCDGKKIFQF